MKFRTIVSRLLAITRRRKLIRLVAPQAIFGLLMISQAQGAGNPYDEKWHFSLTPYLWLPSMGGDVSLDVPPTAGGANRKVDVDIGSSEILPHIDFAFMGSAEARKGRWNIFTDFVSVSLSKENTGVGSVTSPTGAVEIPVDTGSQLKLKGFIWTFALAYTVVREPTWTMDLLAGWRDTQLKTSLNWRFSGPLAAIAQAGNHSQTRVLMDGIIGAKGKIRISKSGRWFIPYYADIGTGASESTWQLATGVGYLFNWGALSLDYRALHYSTDGRVIKNLTLYGPALGATFHF